MIKCSRCHRPLKAPAITSGNLTIGPVCANRMDCAKLHLSIEFVPPNRRGFDLDNLLARLKSGLDGLSDVLGVNDRNWSLTITRSDTVGGMVRVTIVEAA